MVNIKKTIQIICFVNTILVTNLIPNIIQAQWIQSSGIYSSIDVIQISDFAINNSFTFVGTYGEGVYRSANNGESWRKITSGMDHPLSDYVTSLAVSNTHIFAGTYMGGLYVSTNNGTNWVRNNSLYTFCDGDSRANIIYDIIMINGVVYVATAGSGLFRSTDDGSTWTLIREGLPTYGFIINILGSDGTNLYAGTNGDGIFLSTNNGTTWTEINNGLTTGYYGADYVMSLTFIGTEIYAATDGEGIFKSTNYGVNWISVNTGLPTTSWPSFIGVRALASIGENLFAGFDGEGVYLSTNRGLNWAPINNGLSEPDVNTLAISGEFLLAGTYYDGVWRRPLSELITEVNDFSVPSELILYPNYPNPFNPLTKISFSLPQPQRVSLIITDILGREIIRLIDNQEKDIGNYNLKFDGSQLASGIYFYCLQTDNRIIVKKMILLK